MADEDGSGDDAMIQVSAGAVIYGEGLPQLLVEVEFAGVNGSGKNANKTYFWVDAETHVQASSDEGGASIPMVELNIVPVTVNGPQADLRYFPISILRYLDLGINTSVTVRVIGWKFDQTKPIATIGAFKRLSAFAEMTVDVLGARYLNFANDRAFLGAQIADVDLEGGLAWDLGRSISLRLCFGGEESASAGMTGNSVAFTMSSELYGKLELLMKTLRGDFSVFTQGEYERLDVASASSFDAGEYELIVGVGGAF